MLFALSDIVRMARVAMDENNRSAVLAGFGDEDTLLLDELLLSKVADAARLVTMSAPLRMVDNGRPMVDEDGGNVYGMSGGAGYVLLPADFMRLLVFRMSDWRRPVTVAVTPESPVYAMQCSPYLGVRGNPDRPVCALVPRSSGLSLEWYSSGEGAEIAQAQYVARPAVAGGRIDISGRLVRAVAHECGALALAAMGETALAGVLGQQAMALAEVETPQTENV